MPGYVVVGTQWGDEGKGKVVDYLGSEMDYVVRFQGGNNAGHTVVVNDDKVVLHLLPSGVLQQATCIIGPGVVVDPFVFLKEIASLEEKGIYVSAGSACSSNKPSVSRTLKAIGLKNNLLDSTVRFSFCESTTKEELDYTIANLKEIIPFRRKFTRK